MEQIFNTRRFYQLLRSHWAEYKKRYLLFSLAMFGIMLFGTICLFAVDGYRAVNVEMQYVLYHFAYGTAACIFSGTFLSSLNDKSKGITYIMTPASILEKLLCTLVFTIPIFFILYTLIFYLIDIPAIAIANSLKYSEFLHDKIYVTTYDGIPKPPIFEAIPLMSIFKEVRANEGDYANQSYYFFTQMFFIVFSAQAFFLMGAAYFKKFAFVKTILSAFLLMLFFTVFCAILFKNTSSSEYLFTNYFSSKPIKDSYYWLFGGIVWFFKLGLGCLFYVITFFHIKDKEL